MITQSAPEVRTTVLAALRTTERPLLLGHVNIDGDALGAAVALAAGLRARGARPLIVLDEAPPRLFDFLLAPGEFVVVETAEQACAVTATADLAIVLDNNSWQRLGAMEAALRGAQFSVLCIDHHPAVQPFSPWHLVDTGAAATGLLVQELLEEQRWLPEARAADALYTAFVNDTGWFRWSNTDARLFGAAQRLIGYGAQPQRVAGALGQRESLAGKKLLARFLDTVELAAEGRVALGWVSAAMFAETGAVRADSEDFVNHLRSLEGVDIAAFLREETQGVKLSFRTRAPHSALALAQQFEGGGHVLAAGGTDRGSLTESIAAVRLAAIKTVTAPRVPLP